MHCVSSWQCGLTLGAKVGAQLLVTKLKTISWKRSPTMHERSINRHCLTLFVRHAGPPAHCRAPTPIHLWSRSDKARQLTAFPHLLASLPRPVTCFFPRERFASRELVHCVR